MPHLDKKTWIFIGVGAALIVAYMYYRNKSGSSSSTSTPADTGAPIGTVSDGSGGGTDFGSGYGSGVDYSSQIASDESAISGLQSSLSAATSQEQADYSAVGSQFSGLNSLISSGAFTGATGATGPTGPAGGMSSDAQATITSILAGQSKQTAQITALTKQLNKGHSTKSATTHSKPPGSSNANHPTGTAKSAIAAVNHLGGAKMGVAVNPFYVAPAPPKKTAPAPPKKTVSRKK